MHTYFTHIAASSTVIDDMHIRSCKNLISTSIVIIFYNQFYEKNIASLKGFNTIWR